MSSASLWRQTDDVHTAVSLPTERSFIHQARGAWGCGGGLEPIPGADEGGGGGFELS